jgi:hypothetical protein
MVSLEPLIFPMPLTELTNVHDVILVLENGGLVVVDIEVIWCGEDGHDTGETRCPRLTVHAVSSILGFVGAYYREKVILLEECACGRVGEEVRASSNVVMDEEIGCFLLTKLFQWIGPEDVAHQALSGRFPETINLRPVSNAPQLRPAQLTFFRSSRVWSSGLKPPCIHRNCLFMTAAKGRAQKESMQAS